MKKTNFLKAFAMAAVVMFAASCSEETLDINNGSINVDPTVLPEPTASVSVTVVDLMAGKIIGGISTKNATDYIGKTMPVECPPNPGYTTAATVEVAIPELSKGQSINIPVTFYVTTLGSALENFMREATTSTPEAIEGVEPTTEEISILSKDAENKAKGWVNGVYTNDTDIDLIAWNDSPEFAYAMKSGYEFVEEVVDSKSATTLAELLSLIKFENITGYNSWDINKYTTFAVKSLTQKFYLAKIKIENKELGQSITFIANVAGEVTFKTEATKIEIDHNLGHEDINNGHEDINKGHEDINNSHNNGHNGHNGHGGSNAGGGIGGNEGE